MAKSYWIALICVSAIAAPSAAAELPAPSLDPVPLFNTMCTQGGGRLPGSAVTAQNYDTMPAAARVVLGVGAPEARDRGSDLFSALSASQVPNQIYRIGAQGGDMYLIVPKPGADGVMADSCAVIWKGHGFDAARHAITDFVGLDRSASDPYVTGTDIKGFGISGKGYSFKTAEVDGWTILRATPETRTAAK